MWCRAAAAHLLTCPHAAVKKCEPAVEGIGELVSDLNASNNLSRFVLAMRAQFKAMV